MHWTRTTILSSFLIASLATPGRAQREEASGRSPQQREAASVAASATEYVRAKTIVGADVFATGQGGTETREREGAGMRKIAGVDDLVVDTSNGDIAFAVLTTGALVGMGRAGRGTRGLHWNTSEKRLELGGSTGGMPRDAAADRSPGGEEGQPQRRDRQPDPAQGATERTRPGDMEGPGDIESGTGGPGRRAGGTTLTRLMMLDKLRELDVHPDGSSENFGAVDEVYIDAKRGSVAFVSVSEGGVLGIGNKKVLVPWQLVEVQTMPGTGELAINVKLDRTKLENAPVIESVDDLGEPSFMQKVHGFYPELGEGASTGRDR